MYQVHKKWKQKQMKQEKKLRWSIEPKARFFERLKKNTQTFWKYDQGKEREHTQC